MTDVITGLRQVIQDLVAPDLKALAAGQAALKDQMALQFKAVQEQADIQNKVIMATLEAFRAELRSEFAALRATNQLEVLRQTGPLSERVSVVEAKTGTTR